MGEMRIESSAGTLSLDSYGVIRSREFGANDWQEISFDWNDNDFTRDCVYLTNRHVVDHIRTGSPVMNTALEYLVNLQIEEAIYNSVQTV